MYAISQHDETSAKARREEIWAVRIFIFVMIGLAIGAIVQDIRRPLWTDEILTLIVSNQPTISDLYSAIHDGMDSQAPLYPLIIRALRPFIRSDGLRVRLPSTIG